ncbi:sigma-54-dependent transcriptional regulator [Neptunicella sp. SCSIO 80796]|uniref:sigma-54-dependent transcriptional regulator n=1 Tax=Neptunicella plasticusilytica TaxID=3117012 RepID=UPI003A4DC785
MDKHQGHILIVDDDEDILVAGKLLLKRHFSDVSICNQPQHIPTLLAEHSFDAILLDMNFGPGESSGQQGYQWLQRILQLDPLAVVVMITAHGGVDTVVEAMKLGATDFIAKPWQNEKVVATLSAAVQLGQSRRETQRLRQTNQLLSNASVPTSGPFILGNSVAMQQVMSLIERSAPTDANVLILGENGTGKELVARQLHAQSQRSANVFMAVDLGAVSETLFESELFGHKKGAFTGANEDRIGRLQAANGGTLFLDEIGNIPLHLQAKLLTVLAQRQVTPLGTNKPIDIDVRVIAATNVAKAELTNESRFRQDLLFRLNTVEIVLPPLRERQEDIEPIARHYLALYAKKYAKPDMSLATAALQKIQHYPWPGNVRALRHAIERAVILSISAQLTEQDFQLELTPNQAGEMAVEAKLSAVSKPDLLASKDDLNLERLEKTAIEHALKTHRFNISHAARALGLTRAALYRRMDKHGL